METKSWDSRWEAVETRIVRLSARTILQLVIGQLMRFIMLNDCFKAAKDIDIWYESVLTIPDLWRNDCGKATEILQVNLFHGLFFIPRCYMRIRQLSCDCVQVAGYAFNCKIVFLKRKFYPRFFSNSSSFFSFCSLYHFTFLLMLIIFCPFLFPLFVLHSSSYLPLRFLLISSS